MVRPAETFRQTSIEASPYRARASREASPYRARASREASPYRARASRPPRRASFYYAVAPPLLCEEGNPLLCEEGNGRHSGCIGKPEYLFGTALVISIPLCFERSIIDFINPEHG